MAGETVKSVKNKIPGLGGEESGEEGSGGSQDGPGDVKVTSIVESIDVGVPLRTAYDHWSDRPSSAFRYARAVRRGRARQNKLASEAKKSFERGIRESCGPCGILSAIGVFTLSTMIPAPRRRERSPMPGAHANGPGA